MQLDDLKCCGNCSKRVSLDMGDYFEENCLINNTLESFKICDKWEYDGILWQKREK